MLPTEQAQRTDPHHWIIGDPNGRRVADYRAAAISCGLLPPSCLCWSEVIDQGRPALEQIAVGSRLRIDSFGQREDSIAALIRYGGGEQIPHRAEIKSLNHQYTGLSRLMTEMRDWLRTRLDVRADLHPSDIADMFDKWTTHERMLPHRPMTILLPTDWDEFDRDVTAFARACGGRIFVKPRFASSASGVCHYRIAGDRRQLIAPIEVVRESGAVRLFNSLKVRSFIDPTDIRDIFQVLAPQGLIAEAAVNKARIEGDRFDLRIVVINGNADFVVVRRSGSPITNLHLGNQRGTIDAAIEAVGAKRIRECQALAVEAASRFPRALHCGIDILLPRGGEPLVCEVNAFGDLIPRLKANGQSVYQAILRAGARCVASATHERELMV